MTRPLSGDQGLAFQAHTLQIILFGYFTYEPNIICGSLLIVSLQNSIIEIVENKTKPKPQFINEKISKVLNLKKKKGVK